MNSNLSMFFQALFGMILSIGLVFIWIYGIWLWDNAESMQDMIIYSLVSIIWILCTLVFSFYFDEKHNIL